MSTTKSTKRTRKKIDVFWISRVSVHSHLHCFYIFRLKSFIDYFSFERLTIARAPKTHKKTIRKDYERAAKKKQRYLSFYFISSSGRHSMCASSSVFFRFVLLLLCVAGQIRPSSVSMSLLLCLVLSTSTKNSSDSERGQATEYTVHRRRYTRVSRSFSFTQTWKNCRRRPETYSVNC